VIGEVKNRALRRARRKLAVAYAGSPHRQRHCQPDRRRNVL